MKQGMELGLSQKLDLGQYLTPQLILNLKLLQMPTLELEAAVRQELEENPALEQVDEDLEASGTDEQQVIETVESVLAESQGQMTEAVGAVAPHAPVSSDSESAPTATELRPGEIDTPQELPADAYSVDDLMPDDGGLPGLPSSGRQEGGADPWELVAEPEPDLRESLLPRLQAVLPEEDARVAERVLDFLTEDGFLAVEEAELSRNLDVDLGQLHRILYVIQRIEPGGIGCRNQQHAFQVQLELLGADPAGLEFQLVTIYWNLLLAKKVDRIARLSGTNEEQVRNAVAKILTLEPRPARRFSSDRTEYVSPDFSVELRDGRPVAEANDDTFPRLRLSRRYVEILRNPKAFSREQVLFAREKFNRALLFLRGIESRRRTLRRLMDLVVRDQEDFFLKGPEHLKPATIKGAAERLGVHPSTASRATSGKYVETCYGIFPLKYFFCAGTGDKSRMSIKERIRQMVEAEDKSCPLSDDDMVRLLQKEGIKVARRTVAKYRDELGIPGRNQRGTL